MKKIKLFKNKPENWILKLVSLCLAIMLWYFVVGEDQVDINIQVPIEILNLPETVSSFPISTKEILMFRFAVPRSMIQELRNKNITRPVDLSNAEPGTIVIKNDENPFLFPGALPYSGCSRPISPFCSTSSFRKTSPSSRLPKENRPRGYELQKRFILTRTN